MVEIKLDITGKITSIDAERGKILIEILEDKTGKRHRIDSMPEEIYRRIGLDGNYLLENSIHYKENRFSGESSDRVYVSGDWTLKVLSGHLKGRIYTHSLAENFSKYD